MSYKRITISLFVITIFFGSAISYLYKKRPMYFDFLFFNYFSSKPTIRVKGINFYYELTNRAKILPELPIILDVLNERYNVKYVQENYDVLIHGIQGDPVDIKNDKVIKIFYTSEAFLGNPKNYLKSYDLVMGFDYIDSPNYIRVPFSYTRYRQKIDHTYVRNKGICNPQAKEHFACFLASNSGTWDPSFTGARDRTRLFHRLSLYKTVVSGGKHLNNMPGGKLLPIGETDSWLSKCKFTIAYENQHYPGYITEKPFQAWFAGTIPLYDSDRKALEDINHKAVIYRPDFASEDEFVDYIIKVDNDDKLYCEIWNQPLMIDPDKDYDVIKAKVIRKLNALLDEKFKK